MKIIFSLFPTPPFVEFPQGLAGWLGWLLSLALIFALSWYLRKFTHKWSNKQTGLLILFLVMAPLLNLLIGVRLPPASQALPPPLIPQEPLGAAIMIFSAIPWVLAGGMLGPVPAALVGFTSGLTRALWETHNPFTPVEIMLLALLFGAALHQRYRTRFFRIIQNPIAMAVFLTIFYPLLSLATAPLTARGLLASRMDYAINRLGASTLSMGVELLVAGTIAMIIAIALPTAWGGRGALVPAPSEKSLQTRFLSNIAPLAVLLMISLMVGDWIVAGNAARELLKEQMENAAKIAAEGVPYFLESGQSLIKDLASDPKLYTVRDAELAQVVEYKLRSVPYFRQLYLLDSQGSLLVGYPDNDYQDTLTPQEEQAGVQLALNGIDVQSYTAPPASGENAAQVSFIASVQDQSGTIQGVLIGRTDLATNPSTAPILNSLTDLVGEDGEGLLLDDYGRILYHSDAARVMTNYTGLIADEAVFYDATAPDGTRNLVYYQPAAGRPWGIALTLPARRAQELAIQIAAPLLWMIIGLSLVSVVILRFGLQSVTGSLHNLSVEARRISDGQLDHPLQVTGEDEIGQLRRAFETMRASLKARLDELNLLLMVSQGVASSLEMSEAVQPVLDSALSTGACSARIVLAPAMLPELDGTSSAPQTYQAGPAKNRYSYLDEQILALSQQQERVIMPNISRPRMIRFSQENLRPDLLLAIALRHENMYYGTLWLAFDQPHLFPQDEVRFVATLASQAALAAANTRLFLNAELGRQRLAAILASTPDAVLVTDQHNQLLLANPAAWQVLGLGVDTGEGQPVEAVISQPELLELLHSDSVEKQSAEIQLPTGEVYLATASSVMAEGQIVGRVCTLRDVTYFKELDTLKSDFVSTVSHDLRSPLTLMRGYATMLEMVGELNEQQLGYIRKIVGGVENMSRLVNNLLDLGRIEAGIDLQLELVPVYDVVERVVSNMQLESSQKNIRLSSEISQQTVPLIEADPSLLQQALQNLVENAIKYTKPSGKIHVQVQTRQDRIVFEVRDTGIGISPMDQPRLFEKFYRSAQQSSKEQRGTGLGLAIVKSIIERHGGQVWVESQLGKGSTFYMAVPIRQPKKEL